MNGDKELMTTVWTIYEGGIRMPRVHDPDHRMSRMRVEPGHMALRDRDES